MSTVAAGPFLAVTGLVALAGAAKVVRPGGTVRALRAAGVPGPPAIGRLVGAIELAVAAAAVAAGSRPVALVVVAVYLSFAAFTLRLIARQAQQGGVADCGCFGQASSPATSRHVLLNLGAAGLAATAAVAPPGDIVAVMADQPFAGIPFLALTLIAVWAGYVAFTLLPQLQLAISATGSAR